VFVTIERLAIPVGHHTGIVNDVPDEPARRGSDDGRTIGSLTEAAA